MLVQEGREVHGRGLDGAHRVGCKALLDVLDVVVELRVGYGCWIDLLPFARALACGPFFFCAVIEHLEESVAVLGIDGGDAYLLRDDVELVLHPVVMGFAQCLDVYFSPLTHPFF